MIRKATPGKGQLENPSVRLPAGRLKKALCFFEPVWPLFAFYLLGILMLTAFRFLLCANSLDRVLEIENWYMVFPIGLRMDTLLLCYILLPPFVLMLLLPARAVRFGKWIFSLYFSVLAAAAVFLEIASFPFMAEFDTRPDRLFIEYLGDWREVSGMILQGYRAEVLTGLPATALSGVVVFMLIRRMFKSYSPVPFVKRLVFFIIFVPLIFLGARSSISHRPANISTASFSNSHLVNQLGLNSLYSLAYAWRNQQRDESDPVRFYGKLPLPELLSRVRKYMLNPDTSRGGSSIPQIHTQGSRFPNQKPYNLVIILEESLGAEYVGCLGGLPLTPHIDRLSKEGLLFTNLYATGTRTARGIEAVVCGFLPTPGRSIVKLGLSQHRFFTLAGLLHRQGYTTEFIYGGDSQFDNMRGFFLGNGFQQVYDFKTFSHPVFEGSWGVSDEDLFNKANSVLKSHGDAPFFALILSASNHDPFEFPDGRIDLYEEPKMTRHNSMKYADYALGTFFEMAKKESYYENTVFLVIADHSTRLRGQDLVPVSKFHIPGLIIGPNVTPGIYDKVASQIDMAPTLLDLMGVNARTPMIGCSLLSLPENLPGRAVMQYGDTHAFRVGNQVVIQRPGMEPVQATYENGELLITPLDPELARDALAHALLPGHLYKNQLYRLPDEEKSGSNGTTVADIKLN